jgi:anion-transporting  ArsA/GET3 family ATPase
MNVVRNKTSVLICVGSGGVGKTTVASVLGLHHALLGKRTLVITLDPAKRLMDALSLKGKGEKPTKVDIKKLTGRSVPRGGALMALMPDLKKEWLDFLQASIERDAVRHKIVTNHFYQYMAEGLPGSLEIICSHILFRLMETGEFDLIILDTPPSSHSLAFFDVPNKVSAVLEEPVFQKLMSKRTSFLLKLTKNLAFFSGGIIEKTFERLIGSHFLSELIDFALTIDGLYAPMLERTKAMERLLKSSDTSYVLVVRPTTASVNDSAELKQSLSTRGITIGQVVINQVMPIISQATLEQELSTLSPHHQALLERTLLVYRNMARFEAQLLADAKQQLSVFDQRILLKNPLLDRVNLLSELLRNYEEGAR